MFGARWVRCVRSPRESEAVLGRSAESVEVLEGGRIFTVHSGNQV